MCHRTDVFIAEARGTEAEAAVLSSFPFLHHTSALRRCISSHLNPEQRRMEHRELNAAQIKATGVITGFLTGFDSELLITASILLHDRMTLGDGIYCL